MFSKKSYKIQKKDDMFHLSFNDDINNSSLLVESIIKTSSIINIHCNFFFDSNSNELIFKANSVTSLLDFIKQNK
jgi:hypothetical protein